MLNQLKKCNLCPRKCGANRYITNGVCGATSQLKVAKAFLHQWEEPCISGTAGSGAVFFSNCSLKCVYCQNYEISQNNYGKEITIEKLAEIFISLQNQGAHNINLVSPTPYVLHIIEAIISAKKEGLTIPIIYNTNGYETIETIKLLNGLIDIYLPDIKYFSGLLSEKYSGIENYFNFTSKAVIEMKNQIGGNLFDEKNMLQRGLIIRHLILPALSSDSRKILQWIAENIGCDTYISLMGQYTPLFKANEISPLNRKLTNREYDRVINYFFEFGLKNGFTQNLSSSTTDYVPDFNLSGLD